jgi:hypothetical protein
MLAEVAFEPLIAARVAVQAQRSAPKLSSREITRF